MTIREAVENDIQRVRKPIWASPEEYFLLPLFPDGTYGPWISLFSDRVQQDVLGIEPGSQQVLIYDIFDEDGFEEYKGPISEDEPAYPKRCDSDDI